MLEDRMTDQTLLCLLADFYASHIRMCQFMANARFRFNLGNDREVWDNLFQWCLARDRSEEILDKFKHYYPQAVALKQGVSYDS